MKCHICNEEAEDTCIACDKPACEEHLTSIGVCTECREESAIWEAADFFYDYYRIAGGK